MGTVYSNFAADVVSLMVASDKYGTPADSDYTRLCLGSDETTECSGGNYASVPTTAAGWSASGGVATNANRVYFPINESSTAYTAAYFMIRHRIGTSGTAKPIIYSHAFELGSMSVGQNQRVKLNAYNASLHRGIYIKLEVTAS